MEAALRPVVTKPFDADHLTARIQVAERIRGLPIAYIVRPKGVGQVDLPLLRWNKGKQSTIAEAAVMGALELARLALEREEDERAAALKRGSGERRFSPTCSAAP
jgi:hypothetical protein